MVDFLSLQQWILNNIIGLAFCMNAIELISLDTVSVGCLLLGGLFLYDIFWVFGTDVMVTVAKGLEVPIKCEWRRKLLKEGERKEEREREICIMSPLFLYICSGISNGLVGERSTCQQFWHARTWRHCSTWHLHCTSLPIRQRVRPSHPYHHIKIIM